MQHAWKPAPVFQLAAGEERNFLRGRFAAVGRADADCRPPAGGGLVVVGRSAPSRNRDEAPAELEV